MNNYLLFLILQLEKCKGFGSRRINNKDCLIYKIDEGAIYIISCRQHYTDH